jgi:indolepyruvate ferredoxin oxidoreductase beta subunit
MIERANILVAGVGGQGTLLASDILAELGMAAGLDAKKSDVLGLAVRGGSVLSHVRWGPRIDSPVVKIGEMDFMLAFEPLEALRGVPLLRGSATVVCNTQPVIPISASSGSALYPTPEEIDSALGHAVESVITLDATALAVGIGTPRVTNVVMLGAFSTLFDLGVDLWEDVVLSRVPPRFVELNRAAFRCGREHLEKERG